MVVNDSNLVPKKSHNYYCKKCDFECNKKSNWDRHIITRKHVNGSNMVVNDSILVPKSANFNCVCGKTYKWESGYYRHKKLCSGIQEDNSTNVTICEPTQQDKTDVTQKLVELIMSKNQEFMTELVTNLTHSNKDVVNKMMEIMPSMGNNSHNTNSNNTTNNNQFNIQMFLNDHCKNAMNLTDFIDSLPITAETYESTIDNGLTKTITNMITNGLSQLDVLERPIHCTDASRKTLYVKEDNAWEKDNELVKILLGIRQLASHQRTLINTWKDVHDDWNTNDRMQTRFTSLICNSITDIENDEKETNKIIRSISKTVYLNTEVKNMYIE
jgi:NACalpha-BTF3-like transcription factor